MWEHSGAIAAEGSALDSDPLGSGIYGMGHKKVPVFYKTTTVQRKFCVPFPCPFRSTYYRVYFCCVGKIILSTWNGEQTVKKNGEKNVVSM